MPGTCCSVPGCSLTGGHEFPSNMKVREAWIIAIRRIDCEGRPWIPSGTSVVCKAHFKPSDYQTINYTGTTAKKMRLKKDAVPSRFPWTSKSTAVKSVPLESHPATVPSPEVIHHGSEITNDAISSNSFMALRVLDVSICSICQQKQSQEGFSAADSALMMLLPSGFKHCICASTMGEKGIRGTVRVDCSTVKCMENWIIEFQHQSKMTFVVDRSRPANGQQVLYKRDFRCVHNARFASATAFLKSSCEDTNCEAKMTVHLQKSNFLHKSSEPPGSSYRTMSQSKDPHIPHFPMTVTFDFCHNHDVPMLRHCNVEPKVQTNINQLNEDNNSCSPSSSSSPMHSEDESIQEDATDLTNLDCLDTAFQKIRDTYKSYPLTIGPAIKAFCEQVNSMSTVAEMHAALYSFGKYN